MVSQIEEHGLEYRVKWNNPLDERRPRKRQIFADEDKLVVQEFQRWIADVGHVYYQDADIITSGEWLHGVKAKVSLGKTFDEFAIEIILAGGRASDRTKRAEIGQIRNHFPEWRGVPMANLKRNEVKAKLDRFNSDPRVAHKSAYGYIYLAKAIFKAAAAMGIIKWNPFLFDDDGVYSELPLGEKATSAHKVRKARDIDSLFLLDEYVDALISAAPNYQTDLMIRTILATGMRIGEALAVRKNVLLLAGDDPLIQIKLAVAKDPDGGGTPILTHPKVSSYGSVAVPLALAQELQTYTANMKPDDFIFPSVRPNGRGLRHMGYHSFLDYRWKPLVRRAREEFGLPEHIKPTPHCLRHTFASRLYAAKHSTKYISAALRHQNELITTRTYGHLEMAKVRQEIRETQAKFDQRIYADVITLMNDDAA